MLCWVGSGGGHPIPESRYLRPESGVKISPETSGFGAVELLLSNSSPRLQHSIAGLPEEPRAWCAALDGHPAAPTRAHALACVALCALRFQHHQLHARRRRAAHERRDAPHLGLVRPPRPPLRSRRCRPAHPRRGGRGGGVGGSPGSGHTPFGVALAVALSLPHAHLRLACAVVIVLVSCRFCQARAARKEEEAKEWSGAWSGATLLHFAAL